jgi:hypothetical protein
MILYVYILFLQKKLEKKCQFWLEICIAINKDDQNIGSQEKRQFTPKIAEIIIVTLPLNVRYRKLQHRRGLFVNGRRPDLQIVEVVIVHAIDANVGAVLVLAFGRGGQCYDSCKAFSSLPSSNPPV